MIFVSIAVLVLKHFSEGGHPFNEVHKGRLLECDIIFGNCISKNHAMLESQNVLCVTDLGQKNTKAKNSVH